MANLSIRFDRISFDRISFDKLSFDKLSFDRLSVEMSVVAKRTTRQSLKLAGLYNADFLQLEIDDNALGVAHVALVLLFELL